jgi:hypothetical protein
MDAPGGVDEADVREDLGEVCTLARSLPLDAAAAIQSK